MIKGKGSKWTNHGSIFIGNSTAVASVEIDDGGSVDFMGQVIVTQNGSLCVTSTGTLNGTELFNIGQTSFAGSHQVFDNFVHNEGRIIIEDNSSITFLGQVTHYGQAITTGANSILTVKGPLRGFGVFDGAGIVQLDGDLVIKEAVNAIATLSFFGESLSISSESTSFIDIAGTNPGEFDQVNVAGNVELGGSLQVSLDTNLQSDMSFLILTTGYTRSGVFTGLEQGSIVLTANGFDLLIDYFGGDGNDILLTTGPLNNTVPAMGRKLLDGVGIGGSLSDATTSDDAYYQLDPSPTKNPAKQIVDMILLSESGTSAPTSFGFVLEAAMSGGPPGDVIQSIHLWNETIKQWEIMDVRAATNVDLSVNFVASGDLTRFVHPLTSEIIARVKWESSEFSGPPFNWAVEIDQIGWLID